MPRLFFLFSGLSAIALSACASAPVADRPFEVVAMAPDGSLLAQEATVRAERPGVLVELNPLSSSQRAEWIKRRLKLEEDPLIRRGLGDHFLTFRMVIRATGDLPVHLETQSIRLWPDDHSASRAPLDYTRSYDLLRPDRESSPDESEVKGFMRGLYDGPVYLDAGEGREGLLLFPNLSTASERMIMELPFIQVGSKTHKIQLPFSKHFLDPDDPGKN